MSSGTLANVRPQSSSTALLRFGLVPVIAFQILVALNVDAKREVWVYSDWLSNYSAGFVRRGLLGWLLGIPGSVVPLQFLVMGLHVVLYVAFGVLLYRVFNPLKSHFALMLVLFSPAALLFYVFEHHAIGRKDDLLLILILATMLALDRPALSPAAMWSRLAGICAASVALVLSHEGLFFWLPFLDAIVLLGLARSVPLGRAAVTAAALLAVQSAAFLAVLVSRPVFDAPQRICASLGSAAPNNCASDGAIRYIRNDISFALADVYRSVQEGYLLVYGPVLAIMLVAIVMLLRQYRFEGPDGRRKLALGLIATAALATLPIFVVATDWGRWLHLTVMCALFGITFLIRDGSLRLREDTMLQAPPTRGIRLARNVATALFLVSWNPPLASPTRIGFGAFDVAGRVLGMLHVLR